MTSWLTLAHVARRSAALVVDLTESGYSELSWCTENASTPYQKNMIPLCYLLL